MWLPQEPRRWVEVPQIRRGQQEQRGGSPKHKATQGEGEGTGSAWCGRGAGPSFSLGK